MMQILREIHERIILAVILLASSFTAAGESLQQSSVLFQNVRVFDGKNDQLGNPTNVLVRGGLIAAIGQADLDPENEALHVDAAGRTLMPGMIDVHAHLAITTSMSVMNGVVSAEENAIRSAVIAEQFLLDGFTTVRDLGGNVFGLKRAIDSGTVPGPRIYPSGAIISQTSGHGDFRLPQEPHPSTGHVDGGHRLGLSVVADGKDEVYRAVRENLRRGATQIKIMGSGGAGSDFDPIDSLQYQPGEQRAAVATASDWDTYITAHLHYDAAIDRALDSGIRCVDHGFMIKEPTMQKLVEKGVFLAPNLNAMSPRLVELPGLKPVNIEKIRTAQADMGEFLNLIKKYNPKMAFAVDGLGPPENHIRQRRYELYYGAELFGAANTLIRATSLSAELVARSGRRNPYGRLGVIEVGAVADILLIDGNPLEDITLVGGDPRWWDATTAPVETMPLVMKGGQIIRNDL